MHTRDVQTRTIGVKLIYSADFKMCRWKISPGMPPGFSARYTSKIFSLRTVFNSLGYVLNESGYTANWDKSPPFPS